MKIFSLALVTGSTLATYSDLCPGSCRSPINGDVNDCEIDSTKYTLTCGSDSIQLEFDSCVFTKAGADFTQNAQFHFNGITTSTCSGTLAQGTNTISLTFEQAFNDCGFQVTTDDDFIYMGGKFNVDSSIHWVSYNDQSSFPIKMQISRPLEDENIVCAYNRKKSILHSLTVHEATTTAELDLAATNAQDAIVSDLKITVVDPSTGLEKTTTNLVGDTVGVEVAFDALSGSLPDSIFGYYANTCRVIAADTTTSHDLIDVCPDSFSQNNLQLALTGTAASSWTMNPNQSFNFEFEIFTFPDSPASAIECDMVLCVQGQDCLAACTDSPDWNPTP